MQTKTLQEMTFGSETEAGSYTTRRINVDHLVDVGIQIVATPGELLVRMRTGNMSMFSEEFARFAEREAGVHIEELVGPVNTVLMAAALRKAME